MFVVLCVVVATGVVFIVCELYGCCVAGCLRWRCLSCMCCCVVVA